MHVFVTGATGFVGTAVVKELLSAGHSVLGLTRSDKGAEQLKSQGAETLRGTIEELDILKKGASECDAVIHLAFIHDFSNFLKCCEVDRAAITAMGSVLAGAEGGSRALVITSGTMMLAGKEPAQVGKEDDPPNMSNPLGAARGVSEGVCLDFAKQGVRASVVRLPPTTHGPGVSGFSGILANIALQKGVSTYVGDGENVWSACHRDDAAKVYRLAIEKGQPGSIFHAVAEQGVALKDIATAIGKQSNLPVESIGSDKIEEQYGLFNFIAVANNPASSEKTRAELGWTPTAPTLIANMPIIVDFAKSQSAS